MDIQTELPAEKNETKKHTLLYIVLFMTIVVIQIARGWDVPILVFPDETNYINSIRLRPISEAIIPNYLYYHIYKLAEYMPGSFLQNGKIINSILYALAAPFIFMLAKMVCRERMALLITALSMLMPPSIYVVFFIAEPPYFTGFWFFAWLVIRFRNSSPAKYAALCGCVLAVLSFIKVHAIFMLPGLCLYFLLKYRRPSILANIKVWGTAALCAILTFFAVKFTLGYCLAGANGLTLFGKDYSGVYGQGLGQFDWTTFLLHSSHIFIGHLFGLCLVFGFPVLVALRAAFDKTPETDTEDAVSSMALLTLCMLATFMVISCAFTGLISIFLSIGSNKDAFVIQGRYYNFVYPGLLIVCGYMYTFHKNGLGKPPFWLQIIAGFTALMAVMAVATKFKSYVLVLETHYPEVATLVRIVPTILVYPLVILSVGMTVAWLLGKKRVNSVFLFIFLPLYIVSALIASNHHVHYRNARVVHPVAQAAMTIDEYLNHHTDDIVVCVYTESFATMFQYFFHNPNVHTIVTVEAGDIDPAILPKGTKWVITYGRMTVPKRLTQYTENLLTYSGGLERVDLVRVADFNLNVDIAQMKDEWPVAIIRNIDGDLLVRYALFLPKKSKIQLEVPPEERAAGTRYVFTMDDFTDREYQLTPENNYTATVEYEIKPGRTFWLHPLPGPGKKDGGLPTRMLVTPLR